MKPKTCYDCPSLERHLNFCFCTLYAFELSITLAKKVALCRDFEMHHETPTGKMVPVKKVKK